MKTPKKFDYNLLVIGAGSAGLVTSYIAATLRSKVGLIEKGKMGGDCLNTGCVPSKAIIRSAKISSLFQRHKEFGFKEASYEVDFAAVMGRIQNIIKKIEPHDSIERYSKLGVDCIQGAAVIRSPWEVEVHNEILTTKSIVIASGASPIIPQLPGVDKINILTSENVWSLREQPKKLLILGGGPIGCELAQSFRRLGSEVVIVERNEQIMNREDNNVAELIAKKFKTEGIELLTGHTAVEFKSTETKKLLVAEHNGQKKEIEFDQVFCALGRRANTKHFGLKNAGIALNENGTIKVDAYMATNKKHIFACGDVAGPYQFTHMAAHQAYYAAINALFYPYTRWLPPPLSKMLKVDYSVVPWATYTDPEVATVGLTEKSANEQNIKYELTSYGIDDLDRAIADGEDHGFVKVLTQPGSDKVIGATIVHSRASDLILEFIAAMKHGFGLNSILGTIHIYPTMGEANKFLAGNWKKARKPEAALNLLMKFNNWRRG